MVAGPSRGLPVRTEIWPVTILVFTTRLIALTMDLLRWDRKCHRLLFLKQFPKRFLRWFLKPYLKCLRKGPHKLLLMDNIASAPEIATSRVESPLREVDPRPSVEGAIPIPNHLQFREDHPIDLKVPIPIHRNYHLHHIQPNILPHNRRFKHRK